MNCRKYMNDGVIEEFKNKLNIKEDSKLSLYFENNNFITEIHNLNNISVSFFILAMLDRLIIENIIDKKNIIDIINELL